MRGRTLTVPVIGRRAGFVLVAAAIAAAAMHYSHEDRPGPHGTVPIAGPVNPLASELTRCASIGTAAEEDDACEAAWAENRRRFFTYRPDASAAPSAIQAPTAKPEAR